MDTELIKNNLINSWSIEFTETTDSTNNELKRRAENGLRNRTVLIADRQTAGRGRNGHMFYSENSSVYMSMLLSGEEIMSLLTVRAAVAVTKAVRNITGADAGIKWINDVFLDGKKVCGILAESRIPEYAIVGIGVNTGDCSFPDELTDIAGSIGNVCREELISEIINIFDTCRDFIEEYRKLSIVLGKHIEITGKNLFGTATEILDNGNLAVRLDNGNTVILNSGEISVRLI